MPDSSSPTGRYILGVDLGGSMTRVLVADATGRRAGYGTAGGGNPIARGLDATVHSLATALAEALRDVPPDRVGHAVLGLAGVSTFGAAFDAAVDEVWRGAGLTGPRELRPDTEIAYAAGTAEPDGFVLIAGTGAVAGYVRDNRLAHSADGHGWLLGDRGSGFWLGREAAIAALAAGEGNGPETALWPAVRDALALPAACTPVELRRALYGRAPIALAELAPLVTTAAASGDAVAIRILDRAADLLGETLAAVHRAAGSPSGLPVVLAGGVLGAYPPLRGAVHDGIVALGLIPCAAEQAVVGAVTLAVRAATGVPMDPLARTALFG